MILKIFAVMDSKVGAYLPPMYMRSKPEAIRAFAEAANNAEHNFSKYAEDFTMFEVGEWDDSNCSFNLHLTPIPIGKAIEFLHKESVPNMSLAV